MARAKSGPKPTLTRLSELRSEQLADFFALLAERTKGTTRDGKPFYICRFRDMKRSATWMVWADSDRFDECDQNWQPGQFFKIRATYGTHDKYGPQIDVHNIRAVTPADHEAGFQESDFVERSRFDSGTMFGELRGILEGSITDEPLRKLVLLLLDRHGEVLKNLPATQRHFFPFPGGWLEHTLTVVKSCLWLAEQYRAHYPDLTPPLNRDLILAGAALHELGRVVELKPGSELGEPADFTIPGKLFGHLLLGRDLVRDAIRDLPDFNPTMQQLLEHLLMSYLVIPEWGSPRLPMIPEVLILHHADDLDAKMEMYARCLRKDVSEGPFTDRDPVLGKVLLKERDV